MAEIQVIKDKIWKHTKLNSKTNCNNEKCYLVKGDEAIVLLCPLCQRYISYEYK